MLFILSESRVFCTFFAPRVSKIQVVAKMHKMHTIQNKRQRKRAFCTFFAPRVSKIQVVAKMHKMHTIQNERQRKRAFAPFLLLVYQKYKSSQKCTKCTRFRIRGRESAPLHFFAFQFDKRKTKSDLNLMKGEKYADRTFKENG